MTLELVDQEKRTPLQLPFKALKEQSFIMALKKLATSQIHDTGTLKNIVAILKAIDKQSGEVSKLFSDMVKSYAVLTPEGEIALTDGVYTIKEESVEEWGPAKAEFDERTFYLPLFDKIPLEKLDGCSLTPAEIIVLQSIVD